jgi:acyl dehydratase
MFATRDAPEREPTPPRAAAGPLPPAPPPPEARPAAFFEEVEAGVRTELGSYDFTPDNIVAFAQEFDPQPFHLSEEAARKSHFGALCASGWHTGAAWMSCLVESRRRSTEATEAAGLPAPRLGPSPGFKDLRWSKPVYAGDRIAFSSTVTDTRASASRPGWGLVFHRNTGVYLHGEEVFSFQGCVFLERWPA